MKVKVTVAPPGKAFSQWTLKEVWGLYHMRRYVNASLGDFPVLECRRTSSVNEIILSKVVKAIQLVRCITPYQRLVRSY